MESVFSESSWLHEYYKSNIKNTSSVTLKSFNSVVSKITLYWIDDDQKKVSLIMSFRLIEIQVDVSNVFLALKIQRNSEFPLHPPSLYLF